MKLIIAIFLITIANISFSQRLRATFSDDFEKWTYGSYSFRTTFNNDLDNWNCDGTKIRTTFSNDWDQWDIGSNVTMRTVFINDFDGWEIKGYGKTIRVSATFNDDYERWTISGDADGSIRTVFSKDCNSWDLEIDGDIEDELLKAIVFIPIFICSQGML